MQEFKRYAKTRPVTTGLLVVTVSYFLLLQLLFWGRATSSEAIFAMGGLNGFALSLFPQESWRLVTAIFIHIGWEHLILNAVTLYFAGNIAEGIWGSARFLLLYLLSGILGNVFVVFWTPDVVAAGASTSLFGVLASIATLGYVDNNFYLKQLGTTYGGFIIVNLVFNLFMPEVSIWGHLGGAVGGALSAMMVPPLIVHSRQGFQKRLLFGVTYTVLLVTMLAITLSRQYF